ncbi:hypothetical protein, partial [Rhizobium leguminosarum]|uniref:hypothetical protein n=1 Tax=Rhizobium leguminosarum TaxID=384 RepID=UPI001C95B6BC
NSSAEPNRPTSSSQSNAFNESLITMVNHVQLNTVNTKLAHMGSSPRKTERGVAAGARTAAHAGMIGDSSHDWRSCSAWTCSGGVTALAALCKFSKSG